MSDTFNKAVKEAEKIFTQDNAKYVLDNLYSKYEGLDTASQLALAVAPITGEAISAYETDMYADKTKEAFQEGDYVKAGGQGLLTGLSALGTIPLAGMAVRGGKTAVKAALKGLDEPIKITENIPVVPKKNEGRDIREVLGIESKDIIDWRRANTGTGYQEINKESLNKLQKSVQDKLANKIDIEKHISNVEELKPITRWDTVPEIPTFEEIAFSLNPQKGKLFKNKSFKELDTGTILYKNKSIEDGILTTSRLDIPAYEQFDKWIVTLGPKGSKNVYAQTGYFKGGKKGKVEFNPSTKRASKTGTGKETKEPFGLIRGAWSNHNPEELQKYVFLYLSY